LVLKVLIAFARAMRTAAGTVNDYDWAFHPLPVVGFHAPRNLGDKGVQTILKLGRYSIDASFRAVHDMHVIIGERMSYDAPAVPRLRRSVCLRLTQPFRAGLTFGNRAYSPGSIAARRR